MIPGPAGIISDCPIITIKALHNFWLNFGGLEKDEALCLLTVMVHRYSWIVSHTDTVTAQ